MKFDTFLMTAALALTLFVTAPAACMANTEKAPIVIPLGTVEESSAQDFGKLLSETPPSKGYEILEHQSAQRSNKLGNLTVENSNTESATGDQL